MSNDNRQDLLESLAYRSAKWTGSSWAFLITLGFSFAWLVSGAFFFFSDGWQLFMNTVSSTTTFIMVFLLQRSQNKDTIAMQIKLNEIIGALKGANNSLINIENLSEKEIIGLQKRYQNVASHIHTNSESSTHSVITQDLAEEVFNEIEQSKGQ